jgi:hypothetical protein
MLNSVRMALLGTKRRPRPTGVSKLKLGCGALAAAALLAALIAAAVRRDGGGENADGVSAAPSKDSVPPDVQALLDGLTLGQPIGSFQVHFVRRVDRRIGVDLRAGEAVMTVWIAQKGGSAERAPRETERYAIYYGSAPNAAELMNRELDTLLGEFESRIRRTETSVAVPAGL